jgi:5-methylcytosine-specific restriction endonuclease McrA
MRSWRSSHSEEKKNIIRAKNNEAQRLRRLTYPEVIIEQELVRLKAWRLKNPQRVALAKRRRKAKKSESCATLTPTEWANTLKLFNLKCVYCAADWEHQDHFIPLSKGGGYTKYNIVPACAPCNISKSNKMPVNFIGLDKAFDITHTLGLH